MNKLLKRIATTLLGFAMAAGVGVAVSVRKESEPTKAATSLSDLTLVTSADSISTSKKYIVATGNTGTPTFLTDSATSSWGGYATTIGSATEWSITGTIADGFYLSSSAGNLSSLSSKNFSIIDSVPSNKQTVNASGELINKSSTSWKLRYNSTNNGWRWYNSSTGDVGYLYEVASAAASLTYEANGGVGNKMSSTLISNGKATPSACAYTNPGKYFTGWNTEANGSGSSYNAGQEYSFGSATKLYAQWADATLTGISINTAPTSTSYGVGDCFNPSGLVLTLQYDHNAADGTATYGTDSGFSFSPGLDHELELTDTSVTISFGGFTANQTISVNRLKTIVFTPGTDTGSTSVTKGGATATMTSMSGNDFYQIYANQSGTFTATTKIKKIEFTCTASGTTKYGPGNASANVGTYSYSGAVGTWTGNADSVTISTTAQIRMSSLEITIIAPTIEATIQGDSSVNSGTQWSSEGVIDEDDNTVSDVTYDFVGGTGITITDSDTENGTFTATIESGSGTVTVKATASGYSIEDKVVTVNSLAPNVEITLTSSSSPYTGDTVTITASTSNLKGDGLTWTYTNNSIDNASGSISGFTGKLILAGTITITATDNGEGGTASDSIQITVTQTSFSTSPASTASVTEGKTVQLNAALNNGGTIDWTSGDDTIAEVDSTGLVTGVAAGTVTITAKSHNDQNVSATCTVTVNEYVPVIVDGDQFIIKAVYNENDYYFTGVSGNIGTSSTDEEDAIVLTAIEGSTTGQFAFQLPDGTYLSYSGSGNNVYTSETNNSNATLWAVENDGTNDVIESVNVSGRKLKFNYNQGSPRFCCYTSAMVGLFVEKIVIADPTYVTLGTQSLTIPAESSSDKLTFSTDSPQATFKWASQDTNKATVSDGVITAIASSGKVNIYVYFDSDDSDSFDSSIDTVFDTCEVTLTAPVIDYSAVTYGGTGVKITSSNKSTLLVAGKKIIMTYNDEEVAGSYGSYMDATSTSVTFSNSTVTIGDGTAQIGITVLELESATGGFYLKTKDGKYLSHTGSGSSAGNFSKTDEGSTIWVVSEDGIYDKDHSDIATIKCNTTTTPAHRFKTYKSTFTSGGSVVVYSFEEYTDVAITYATNFLNANVCGTNDNTKASASVWAAQYSAWTQINSGAQNILKNGAANADSDDMIQKCLAKYDRVQYLYYNTNERDTYNDFMLRVSNGKVTPRSGNSLILGKTLLGENTNTVAIIVIISMVSVTAIGGYFFLRKRKENI